MNPDPWWLTAEEPEPNKKGRSGGNMVLGHCVIKGPITADEPACDGANQTGAELLKERLMNSLNKFKA